MTVYENILNADVEDPKLQQSEVLSVISPLDSYRSLLWPEMILQPINQQLGMSEYSIICICIC